MSTLATDSFDRADESPIAGNWTSAGDTLNCNIVSNVITSSTFDDASAFYNTGTWPDDQWSQIELTVNGTGGSGQGAGLTVRSATGKNYYRLVLDHAASNNVELAKKVGGTYTSLGTTTRSWTNGDTIYFAVQGTSFTVTHNGVSIGSWPTDSSLTSGKPGVVYSATETSWSGNNWSGGDFDSIAVIICVLEEEEDD